MPTSLRRLLSTGLASGLAFAAGLTLAAPAQAQIALKFGHIVDTQHPIHTSGVAMAEHIARCTNNQVKVDIFPGGQLGNEGALNDQIRIGGVDFANTGASFLSRNFAHLAVSSLPYIFRDRSHALAYATSDVMKELAGGWEKATGQHIIGVYYSSAFHVYAQEPFVRPEDMKGKKIRVPDAPSWMVFFRAINAVPTPMALGEVYLGLRQGVIDGANLPLAVGNAIKAHEVSKVISMTFHQMEMGLLLTGAHVKRRLSADQWKCVETGGQLYAKLAQEGNVKAEDELRDQLTKAGAVRFVDVDMAAYQKATASVIDDKIKAGEFPQALVDRIRAVK
ncbi:MAG: TRAP transporter substrate-binding protein DctP [Alphaproteobacteria bacterium]|nr:TRAP transporter substrate-binding protein DctP [Alphaproteobacteria bacterium]